MSHEELRQFFADVQTGLSVKLGIFCDRNLIFRSEFSNFMKGKYNTLTEYELNNMKNDILDHCEALIEAYKKIG